MRFAKRIANKQPVLPFFGEGGEELFLKILFLHLGERFNKNTLVLNANLHGRSERSKATIRASASAANKTEQSAKGN